MKIKLLEKLMTK